MSRQLATVEVEPQEHAVVVRLAGEIDLSNAEDVRAQVVAAVPHGGAGLVLDLTDATYIDSSGVRLLFDLAERLQARRQRLRVVVTDEALVRRVIVLTRLDSQVPIDRSVEESLEALAWA